MDHGGSQTGTEARSGYQPAAGSIEGTSSSSWTEYGHGMTPLAVSPQILLVVFLTANPINKI
jgi:hypothetical protein